jgi:hypothetical protein
MATIELAARPLALLAAAVVVPDDAGEVAVPEEAGAEAEPEVEPEAVVLATGTPV